MTTISLHTGTSLSGGRYEITQKLGVGGMATVYLAHDNNLNVAVAIKFPDPNLLQNADFRDRFFQETRSLVSLRHPNILKIIDVGQQDGTPYAVMDYLSGGSVNDQRFQDNQGNYLPVVPVFFDKWLNRIADALDFIHRKGYVHRDIKPDNILFDDHGNAFLSDFGIAKVYEETKTSEQANLTRTGMLIGTPEYMAPEISLGQKYDGRSDQYSLAVLVYELLVGSRPFIGATPAALVMKQMQKEFHQLSELQRRWGKSVASVLTRALATEPGARFASCCEFEGELARAFANTPDRHIDERVVSKCPTCSAPIAIQPEWIGRIANCNKCSERIQIQATGMVVPASAVSAIPQQTAGSVPVTNQQPMGPRCPGCVAVLHIAPNLRGKMVKCSACEMLLRISEDGRHCDVATTSSLTPTLNNQSLGPFTDTSPQGLAPISSTYIRPIRKFATKRTSKSKSPLIAIAVSMAAMLGIGVWFLLGSDAVSPIAARISIKPTPPVNKSPAVATSESGNVNSSPASKGNPLPGAANNPSASGKPEQLQAAQTALAKARQILATAKWDQMNAAAEAAAQAAATPEQKQMAKQLVQLAELATHYHDGVEKALDGLKAAETFNVSDQLQISVVEITAEKVVLRFNGRNKDYARAELPLVIAHKIAGFTMQVDAPATKAAAQAYQSLAPVTTPQYREQAIEALEAMRPQLDGVDLADVVAAIRQVFPTAALQTTFSTNSPIPASAASERISPQTPPIAMAPFSENEAKGHQAAWAAYLEKPVELTNSVDMKLKLIPAGTFMMGSAEPEVGRSQNETQHRVTLTKPYYLGTTEVTQGQWESVMGTTPWKGQKQVQEGSNNAASNISWYDAVEFCRKLSAMERKTYRLPTEAEWEYACRGGTTTAYSFGSNAAQLSDYGWWGGFAGNGNSQTEHYAHAVGLNRANAFGLYDMHGNVWEWCSDWYGDYTASAQMDPPGPATGSYRVGRGGGWGSNVWSCRSARRYRDTPDYRISDLGFRVALSSVVERSSAGP